MPGAVAVFAGLPASPHPLRRNAGDDASSWANIAYQSLMQGMRAAIAEGRFEDFRRQTKEQWQRGRSAA